MLSTKEEIEVRALVKISLDKAEKHWLNGGKELSEHSSREAVVSAKSITSEPSKIPGHSLVQDEETVIDEFIAFVADMRDSSQHLMCDISPRRAKVSRLERVFYETSALLPALALTVSFKDGNVTEYLGDGLLALFKVEADKDAKVTVIKAAYNAAENSIGRTREIVNEELYNRYQLPPLDLGVGLAMSKTLITLVGLEGEKHPKAFGECIFRATKLSDGKNTIIIDKMIEGAWPKSKGGLLSFKEKEIKGVVGYLIRRD